MAIFQSDADRRCYLQYIKEETERFGVEILSWCPQNSCLMLT